MRNIQTKVLIAHPRLITAQTLLLVTVLHLFLNGIDLHNRHFWLDESTTFIITMREWKSIALESTLWHAQPPLFYYLAKVWMKIWGASDIVLRGLSWIAVLGTLWLILLTRSLGNAAHRTIAAIVAVSGQFAHYLSGEFRPYAWACLTALMSVVLWGRLSSQRRSHQASFCIVSTLAMLTTTFNLFLGPSLILATLLARSWTSKARLEALAATGLSTLLAATFFVLYPPNTGSAEGWALSARIHEVLNFTRASGFFDFLLKMSVLQLPHAFLIFAALFAVGLFNAWRQRNETLLALGIVGVCHPLLVTFVISTHSFHTHRYFYGSYFPIMLVAAQGLFYCFDKSNSLVTRKLKARMSTTSISFAIAAIFAAYLLVVATPKWLKSIQNPASPNGTRDIIAAIETTKTPTNIYADPLWGVFEYQYLLKSKHIDLAETIAGPTQTAHWDAVSLKESISTRARVGNAQCLLMDIGSNGSEEVARQFKTLSRKYGYASEAQFAKLNLCKLRILISCRTPEQLKQLTPFVRVCPPA